VAHQDHGLPRQLHGQLGSGELAERLRRIEQLRESMIWREPSKHGSKTGIG